MLKMAGLLLFAPVLMAQAAPQVAAYPPSRLDDAEAQRCTDRIEQVRAERGLPPLAKQTGAAGPSDLFDRRPAAPDEGMLYTAVDHRIDGCGVLVMRGNPADVRPVPQPRASRTFIIR